jgi:predicted enzyme related to lactoylglutathione lyase
VAVIEFVSCRPNLEVDDLATAAAFLREVLGFEVEVDEPDMGLMLLRRDAVGLALVRSTTPGVNSTTAAYIGVTGVDDLHDQCVARSARIVTALSDHPWGLRDFVIEIPGGHRLALGERIAQLHLSRVRLVKAPRVAAPSLSAAQNPGANTVGRGWPITGRSRRF